MRQRRWRSEFQIDFASPVSFVSQTKLHEMKIRDSFVDNRIVPKVTRNIFYIAIDDVIKLIGRICEDIKLEGLESPGAEFNITERV